MSTRSKVFKVLGVVVGLVVVGVGFSERSHMSHIKSVGHAAVVDPIENYTKRTKKGSTTYTADFSFKADNGQQVSKKASFPEVLIKDFEQGVPVKVLYDPANPHDFVFEKDEESWFVVGMGVAIAVAAIIFV